jgi:hypothetical protein
MQPYLPYMINKQLPKDVVAARWIVRWSKAFVVVKGELYNKSILVVLQRYVTAQEGQAILKDFHIGICGLMQAVDQSQLKLSKQDFIGLLQSKMQKI